MMHARRARTLALAVLTLTVAVAAPALATDYYVRTDGNNANSGTSNTAGGAWASVSKCASTLQAGDRCLVQAGRYNELGGWTNARGGALVGTYAYGCSFTKGSTSVTCSSAPANVTAGRWIRSVNSGPYFSFTRVASVSGNTITLEEGYRGETAGGDVRVANFVEYRGEGSVTISWAHPKPADVTWTQHSSYPNVWYFAKAGKTAPWNAPSGFREESTSWDLWYGMANGRDTYVKVTSGGCPCNAEPNCAAHVNKIAGSFCDDGTSVYVRTRTGNAPTTADVRASNALTDQIRWNGGTSPDYTAIRNFTFVNPGPQTGITDNSMFYPYAFGGSHALYENLRTENGVCRYELGAARTEMDVRNVQCLNKFMTPTTTAPHSGLRFYNLEARGGYSNTMNFGNLSGTSSTDRVLLQRIYLHRTFTQYRTASCGAGGDYYDCASGTWQSGDTWFGTHGAENGNAINSPGASRHVLLENSIIEVTADGWQWGFGGATSDVIFRNNTFGWSGTASGNWRQELLVLGSSDAGTGWNIKLRNNLFVADQASGDVSNQGQIILYGASENGLDSDYNMFMHPWNTSNKASELIWNDQNGSEGDVTLATAISKFGREQNSMIVCYANCSGSTGRYYNDGANARSYFVQFAPTAGGPSDLTPTSYNRGVNAGDGLECPTEDFYGRPRTDGRCDIGAVELTGGAPDTTPPAAVTNFTATGSDAQVTLQFTHSASSDARGTRIRFRTDTHPVSATDGSLACEKTGTPGAADSCLHTGATNGTRYFYSAFSYDAAGNHGTGAKADATPGSTPNSAPPPVNNNRRNDVM